MAWSQRNYRVSRDLNQDDRGGLSLHKSREFDFESSAIAWKYGSPSRLLRRCAETGFETITLKQTTTLNHGVGGRQYDASKAIEALGSKGNAATSRLGAVEERGSSLTRCGEFAALD
jgi:hypothetical protein